MGNWQLEVFKLGIYVSFPVAMFYFFNQPNLFEDWVVQMKRDLYPPEHRTGRLQIETAIKDIKAKQQSELIQKMQDEERAARNK